MIQQVSVRTSDRIITMVGISLGQRDGCVVESVTPALATRINAALSGPNSGLRLSAEHAVLDVLPAAAPLPAEPDPQTELEEALTAATDFASLKAALLGSVRKGKVAGRAK